MIEFGSWLQRATGADHGDLLLSVVKWAWDITPQGAFVGIVGAGFATYVGARTAQGIADRNKARDDLLRELRSLNTATRLAYSICVVAISVKKQFVKPIVEKYKEDRRKTEAALVQRSDQGQVIINFLADYRTHEALEFPIDLLREQIFNKLSLDSRPVELALTISRVTKSLNSTILERNDLISRFRATVVADHVRMMLYFGFQDEGRTERNYYDHMMAMEAQCDDLIFFAVQLGLDLSRHGKKLDTEFKARFGKGSPGVSTPDFSKAYADGLIPPDADYADWFTAFGKEQLTPGKSNKNRWLNLWRKN